MSLTNCDDYDESNCPTKDACEFNNKAEGTVEPGHCKVGFGLCFCLPDAEPPPPPPPPEEGIDCSTLGTPGACNGDCIFTNIHGKKYKGTCTWIGDPATGDCDCVPDDPDDPGDTSIDPCEGVICGDCETCTDGICKSDCVAAGEYCNAGICETEEVGTETGNAGGY